MCVSIPSWTLIRKQRTHSGIVLNDTIQNTIQINLNKLDDTLQRRQTGQNLKCGHDGRHAMSPSFPAV